MLPLADGEQETGRRTGEEFSTLVAWRVSGDVRSGGGGLGRRGFGRDVGETFEAFAVVEDVADADEDHQLGSVGFAPRACAAVMGS